MAGVYISYPFCAQKCTFCNFASGVYPRELERHYVDALIAEARAHAWEWRPETVYLGGGTPGNMPAETLSAILDSIPGRPWAEATIESAPGAITPDRAREWAACGINRVSLGVQSFVEREIRRTGRKHTAQTVAEEVAALAKAGIRNFNIDLIAGLSGQTEASWRESLDWIERLQPPHVSVYMLEVDEDSRLGRELLRGGARYGAAEAPDEDAVAGFYAVAVERLKAMGILRYEISNFARPGFESRHNLKYWKLEPYVGFGADAHSYDGTVRWQNAEEVEEYVGRTHRSAVDAPVGLRPMADQGVGRRPGGLPHSAERFFVGLRLMEGSRPAPEEWQRYAEPIRRFLDAGLLETEDGILRLTDRGVLLSNEVFQEFIDL